MAVAAAAAEGPLTARRVLRGGQGGPAAQRSRGLRNASAAARSRITSHVGCRVTGFPSMMSSSSARQDADLSVAERLARVGALMNDSHASCADLYGCSCGELDELVAVARAAGALGSRLTGGAGNTKRFG